MTQAGASATALVDVERVTPLIKELDGRLRREGFLTLERYPWPGNSTSLYHDPGIFFRYLRGASNSWRLSAIASTYYQWLARAHPDLWTLCEAFMLCWRVDAARLEGRLGVSACRRWHEAGLLDRIDGSYLSRMRATPWQSRVIWHDAPPGFREGWVFVGADSLTFARHLRFWSATHPTLRYRNALDLCTGSGLHACALSRVADRVTGLDLNPRAIAYARLNAELNRVATASFSVSDLFAAVSGERFDLIVCNPPFLFLPPDLRGRCLDGDGGAMGMELVLRLMRGLPSQLAADGMAILQANSPVVRGRDLLADAMRDEFTGGDWQIDVTAVHEFQDPAFYDLYTANAIERFIAYLIVIRRGYPFTFRRRGLSPWRKTACSLRIAMVRRRGGCR